MVEGDSGSTPFTYRAGSYHPFLLLGMALQQQALFFKPSTSIDEKIERRANKNTEGELIVSQRRIE